MIFIELWNIWTDSSKVSDPTQYQEIPMAVASRTYSPETARILMDMFGIRSYFEYEEIYPSSKVLHFESLQKRTGIPFSRMYFFDDEHRNIVEVGSLGVQAFLVRSGLNWDELRGVPGQSKTPGDSA